LQQCIITKSFPGDKVHTTSYEIAPHKLQH